MPHPLVRISIIATVLFALTSSAHAGTFYVANNGSDGIQCGPGAGFRCGGKTNPCRSITCAINNAAPGDKIIVGPGRYGDLNRNGALGETDEEGGDSYAPGCGCMIAVNKPVSLTSSDGAGVTVVDARTVDLLQNVVILTNGGEFGKPGKGFTVTNTARASGDGIGIDSVDVKVRGNDVVATGDVFGDGIAIPDVSPGPVLVELNSVTGWGSGIFALGHDTTIHKNEVALDTNGIFARGDTIVVAGNVATANSNGISADGGATITGNAAYGNDSGVSVPGIGGVLPKIEKNNFFGNRCGFRTDATQAQVVINNYWGAATGPGADPADPAGTAGCNHYSVPVTSTPFATKPFKVKSPLKQ